MDSNKSKRVDVILPIYNASETLEHSIDSLLHQTHAELRIIAVNDGSTDNTAKLLNGYTDQRLVVFHRPHLGIAKSLNFGLSQSTSDYIARMDADDTCHPQRIEKQLDYLSLHQLKACATHVEYYNKDVVANQGFKNFVAWQNQFDNPKDIYLNRFVDTPFAHPSILFERELLTQYGAYQESGPEDYELWLRWMEAGVQIGMVAEPLLRWVDHTERATRTNPNYNTEHFSELKARYFLQWAKMAAVLQNKNIWICGTGNYVKKKLSPFIQKGMHITGYVDVKAKTVYQNKPVVQYHEVEQQQNAFYLLFVANPKGKQDIRNYFGKLNLVEGKDYYVMA